MKVAILGAMPEEIEPLLSALRERGVSVEAVEHANNKFYAAKLNGHDLVIAYSKIGKVNSALSATVMIEKFGARAHFYGRCGGFEARH